MQKVLVIGAGKCGLAILKIVLETGTMEVWGVVDQYEEAPAMELARQHNIATGTDWRSFLSEEVDVVVETTGSPIILEELQEARHPKMIIVPREVVYSTAVLMDEKEALIRTLKDETYKHDLIFNSTRDGMIVVNQEGIVTFFNRAAESMTGYKREEAVGKHIHNCIPSSRLPAILQTRKMDQNQEFLLQNGRKIITSRMPMIDEEGELFGAFSIFKDITEIVNLAEELTNLKEIQTMLEAIIQSSQEAISVVDEQGRGILINPAYTKLTGLEEKDVIGKPAATDISEGESMHMKVLKTRRPVRGARMKVGPKRKDVIVNVAPIIVDGKLKGSVGVIHDMSEIQVLTTELNRARQIIRTLEAKYSFEDIIGTSQEFRLAVEQAKLGANTPATVLLRGESGTGKELFAHAIHNASDRKYNKFVRVNCAALSETLLESELFGYEDGAFSGARRGGKRGLFEEANNGSIFLDEIGELSAHMQAKLLRVLQENEIVRVGGTVPVSINVRVIAATNVNLERGMASGKIREDLYYRLNKIPIHIPPLRQHKEDIEHMAGRLITKINQDYGRRVEGVTRGAVELLQQYDWPGNVRELENVLGRAMIYMNYNEMWIDIRHIPPLQTHGTKQAGQLQELKNLTGNETLGDLVEKYEAGIIKEVLHKYNGNKTRAAHHLGISIRSLYYKLEKFRIEEKSMQ
jgi:PAS domain S-box-containing protein